MEILYICLGIILIVGVIYFFITYNILVKHSNQVKEAFSVMDVYLKKRWDLIPNLIEIVKGYSEYEKNTFETVVGLRSLNYENMTNLEKYNKGNELSSNIAKLLMLKEDYPELKANEGFLKLSKQLAKVEEDIAQSRKYYNATVREYNNKIEMIPSNIVAKIMGLKAEKMFNVTEEERKVVKVK